MGVRAGRNGAAHPWSGGPGAATLRRAATTSPKEAQMSVQTAVSTAVAEAADRHAPIIVGYDGSPESKLAVQVAAERAGPGGTVVPIHVTVPASDWLGSSSYEPIVAHTHHAAQILLADLDELDVGDVAVEPELIEGDPADALLRIARSRDAR